MAPDAKTPRPADPGLLASLRRLWSALSAIIHTRFELFTREFERERIRVMRRRARRLIVGGKLGSLTFPTPQEGTIMSENSASPAERDEGVSDVRSVLSNAAQDLMRAASAQTGETVMMARARIKDSLELARAKLSDADAMVRERARQAAQYTDEYVRENPWRAIGIAAGIGLVLGLILSRK